MVTYKGAVVMLLTEFVDSDDEEPRWGKTREWIKRRRESSYFQGWKVEDRLGFKDMFRISATDYETLLNQISKLISQNERISGNKFILS